MRLRYMTKVLLLFIALTSVHAASKLAPFYEALAKDPRATADLDLTTVVPSEEIPAIVNMLNSNSDLATKTAVLNDAKTILSVHIADGRPNFHQLQPEMAEVIREFRVLTPILTNQFNGVAPVSDAVYNGTTDYTEIQWKTHVVQFIDIVGDPLTPEMVNWMLKVVQWPNGRVSTAMSKVDNDEVAAGRSPHQGSTRNSISQTISQDARQNALQIIPVLAHMNPMPTSVMTALVEKINDSTEVTASARTIFYLAMNKGIDRLPLGDLLVTKALDKNVPSDIRVASIYAIADSDQPSNMLKLAGLHLDPDNNVAEAAGRVGIRK